MSPELETLDQLLGGDLPLSVIRGLFPDDERFVRAIAAMLENAEVLLLEADGREVPRWSWRNALSTRAEDSPALKLSITDKGARRIG